MSFFRRENRVLNTEQEIVKKHLQWLVAGKDKEKVAEVTVETPMVEFSWQMATILGDQSHCGEEGMHQWRVACGTIDYETTNYCYKIQQAMLCGMWQNVIFVEPKDKKRKLCWMSSGWGTFFAVLPPQWERLRILQELSDSVQQGTIKKYYEPVIERLNA